MTSEFGHPSRPVSSISAKAAYSKAARKKLVESRAQLDGVRAAIRRAVATGNLEPSDRLEVALRATDARLATAEMRLETLQKSGKDGWEELRDELEDAREDLSHSINMLVARIKDVSG